MNFGDAQARKYYIDFSSVRGGNTIKELGRTIARLSPDKPTCQLFTGHIGCGKSTELQRLKAVLEQQGFHGVYFESSQVLEMADVDVTDILLALAPPHQCLKCPFRVTRQAATFNRRFASLIRDSVSVKTTGLNLAYFVLADYDALIGLNAIYIYLQR